MDKVKQKRKALKKVRREKRLEKIKAEELRKKKYKAYKFRDVVVYDDGSFFDTTGLGSAEWADIVGRREVKDYFQGMASRRFLSEVTATGRGKDEFKGVTGFFENARPGDRVTDAFVSLVDITIARELFYEWLEDVKEGKAECFFENTDFDQILKSRLIV